MQITRLLNVFSLALVITSGSAIAYGWVTNLANAPSSSSGEEAMTVRLPTPPRDVYYLVFDRYGSNQTIKTRFGFDNTPFYDRLRQRGFICAERSLANYPKTVISMTSALDMKIHDEVKLPDAEYTEQLQDHRVGRLLKSLGYKYYHLGNWYDPLRSNPHADFNMRVSPLPSEFADVLCGMTPLTLLISESLTPEYGDPRIPPRKFQMLADIAKRDELSFTYAHFILPHEPFIFNRDGSTLLPYDRDRRSIVENTVNQIIYANTQIIETVDHILANSTVAPIIVIQADEGPFLYGGLDDDLDAVGRMRKRCGIISAFYLPDIDAAAVIPQTITPVNTFRIIFREYFGAEIANLPDRAFYWDPTTESGFPDETHGCRFIDVTDKLLEDPSGDSGL